MAQRTITTKEEALELAPSSVVRDTSCFVYERTSGHDTFEQMGSDYSFMADEIAYPAVVLWEPTR